MTNKIEEQDFGVCIHGGDGPSEGVEVAIIGMLGFKK